MSDPSIPGFNNLTWRIGRLERDVDDLKEGQPAVLAERLSNLSKRVQELDDDVRALRRVLVGFLVTFAFFGITLVVSIVTLLGSG